MEERDRIAAMFADMAGDMWPMFNLRGRKALMALSSAGVIDGDAILINPPTVKQLMAIPGCGKITTRQVREEIARVLAARIHWHTTHIQHLMEAQRRWADQGERFGERLKLAMAARELCENNRSWGYEAETGNSRETPEPE